MSSRSYSRDTRWSLAGTRIRLVFPRLQSGHGGALINLERRFKRGPRTNKQ